MATNMTRIVIDHDTGTTRAVFGAEAGDMVRALVTALGAAAAVDRRERLMDAPVCPAPGRTALAAHP